MTEPAVLSSTGALPFDKTLILSSGYGFTTKPLLVSDEVCPSVLASLTRKRANPGSERRTSPKALTRVPLLRVTLIALAGVFFFRLMQQCPFPQSPGLRGIVHYALPPPLTA